MDIYHKIKSLIFPIKESALYSHNIVGVDDDYQMSMKEVHENDNMVTSINNIVSISDVEFAEIYVDNARRHEFINTLIGRLYELQKFAENNKMHKKQYKTLKTKLLNILARLFGNSDSIEDLILTVNRLETLNIVPQNSQDEFIKISPLSRWSG